VVTTQVPEDVHCASRALFTKGRPTA